MSAIEPFATKESPRLNTNSSELVSEATVSLNVVAGSFERSSILAAVLIEFALLTMIDLASLNSKSIENCDCVLIFAVKGTSN